MLELGNGVVLSLRPGIVLQSLPEQDWFFAFSVLTGDQFRLNRTSFWVLEAIGEGREWKDLRDSFVASFEVSPREGEDDLRKLVSDLAKEKIIGRRANGEEESDV